MVELNINKDTASVIAISRRHHVTLVGRSVSHYHHRSHGKERHIAGEHVYRTQQCLQVQYQYVHVCIRTRLALTRTTRYQPTDNELTAVVNTVHHASNRTTGIVMTGILVFA